MYTYIWGQSAQTTTREVSFAIIYIYIFMASHVIR